MLAACSGDAGKATGHLDASGVKSIQIDFHYAGWHFYDENFVLSPATDGNGFVLSADYLHHGKGRAEVRQRVSTEAVQKLLDAASAPALTREQGVRMVASSASAREMSKLGQVISFASFSCTQQERQLMARRYVMRNGRPAVVDDYYGSGNSWTDDYPAAEVQIHLHDGSSISLYSQSQKAMMLPWHRGMPYDRAEEADQNWAAPLSQAIRTILPPQSAMHRRLSKDEFLYHLSMSIDYAVIRECEKLRGVPEQ